MKKEENKKTTAKKTTTTKKETAKKTSTTKKTTAKKATTSKTTATKTKKTTTPKVVEKKRSIVSYEKLPESARLLFDELYEGDSYMDHIQKQEIPGRAPLYLVPFETDDAIYMVKVEVKIDSNIAEEEIEKTIFNDDLDKDDTNLTRGKEQKNFDLVHGGDFADIEHSLEEQGEMDIVSEQDIDFEDEVIEELDPEM